LPFCIGQEGKRRSCPGPEYRLKTGMDEGKKRIASRECYSFREPVYLPQKTDYTLSLFSKRFSRPAKRKAAFKKHYQ
jgi:hypothetical protein